MSPKEWWAGARTVLPRTAPHPERRRSLRGPKGEAVRLAEALGVQGRREVLGKAGWPQGWGVRRRQTDPLERLEEPARSADPAVPSRSITPA